MISNKTIVTTVAIGGERPAIYGPKGETYMYFKDRHGRSYGQEVPPTNYQRIVESISAFLKRRKPVV